jgi:CRISPR system Cascade subunit CasB
MTDTEPKPDVLFIRALNRLVTRDTGEDRAQLARLRRALAHRDLDFNALKDLPELPQGEGHRVDLYLLVAALFALHPKPGNDALGIALRNLRNKLSAGAGSLDQRVTALLNSDREDLPYRLRQVIQMLAAQEVSLKYDRLLQDLKDWDRDDRKVQRQWAKDYYIAS